MLYSSHAMVVIMIHGTSGAKWSTSGLWSMEPSSIDVSWSNLSRSSVLRKLALEDNRRTHPWERRLNLVLWMHLGIPSQ